MKRWKYMSWLPLLLIHTGVLFAQLSSDNVLDFEKIPGAPVIDLTVERYADVYFDFGYYTYLKTLEPGTKVRLLAYTADQYKIQCEKPACKGWVDATKISPVKPDVIEDLKKQLQEEKNFAEAIKKKQVLPGMRPSHVQRALGEPTRKDTRSDANGSHEIWAYITSEKIYETVNTPTTMRDASGRFVTVMMPVRREVGEKETSSLVIEFRDGRAIALQQSRTQSDSGSRKLLPEQKLWR